MKELDATEEKTHYSWSDHALERWDQRFSGINKDIEFASAGNVGKKTKQKIRRWSPVSSKIYLGLEFKGRFYWVGRSGIVFVLCAKSKLIITVFHLHGR